MKSSITDKAIASMLGNYAKLESFVLLEEDGNTSVMIATKQGVSMLLIEDENMKDDAVFFLKRKGAAHFGSMDELYRVTGAGREPLVKPIEPETEQGGGEERR